MGDNNNNNEQTHSFFGGMNSRWSSLIILIIIIAAYLLYSNVFANNESCGGNRNKDKLISTVTLTPASTLFPGIESSSDTLADNSSVDCSEYLEGSSAWTADKANLVFAMYNFYETTGIAPYLYDISNDDAHTKDELQQIAGDYYKEHFSDEQHFLMVFQAGSPDLAAYYVGTEAAVILDEDALTTFQKQLKSSFNDKNVKESDVMTYTYITCADTVMTNPGSNLTFILIIAAVLVFYGIYNYIRNAKKRGQDGGDDSSGSSFQRRMW